jgi:photosystem II stability/assembly factor-like uncharacterized protein
MRFLHLTLLCCLLNIFSFYPAMELPRSSPATILKSTAAQPPIKNKEAANSLIFQSKDGGQTWQDISDGLPANEQPEVFSAGESDVYLRVKNEMYRSKNNLKAPVWEKENISDLQNASIVFNPSGVTAYNYRGEIYQKMHAAETWLPAYTHFKNPSVETILETSDGTIFAGCRDGLYKSSDRGQSWKQVHKEGWVMNIVESDGVLIATGQKGIMRSADNGEHWEWVISEGGVGIAVERIDGGFAAISYNATTRSRRIRVSLDNGNAWKAIDEGLPPSSSISSIKQSGHYLLCGHPEGIFRSADKGKTWIMVHPGVDRQRFQYGGILNIDSSSDYKQVYKLYVSGHVVYAVAKNAGC